MFCSQCGNPVEEQARFCPRCGSMAATQPAMSSLPPAPAAQLPGVAAAAPAIPRGRETESTAVVSMILGVLSVVGFGILTGISAVILGRAARNKIRANPERLTGEGLATAGIVTGWISIGLVALIILIVLIVLMIVGFSGRSLG